MSISEKHSSLTLKQMSQVYRNVFGTVDGQLVLEDLKSRCFAYVPEDFGAEKDRDVFINIGKRAVLLTIETQLKPYKENE